MQKYYCERAGSSISLIIAIWKHCSGFREICSFHCFAKFSCLKNLPAYNYYNVQTVRCDKKAGLNFECGELSVSMEIRKTL